MNNLLEINNLNKTYKNFELKDININVPKGTIVGFIGENGAGKTTTIKAILNLINIDSGNINIFNTNYKENESLIKEDLGVVLDNSYLPEQLKINDINKIFKSAYKNWDETLFYNYVNRFNLPINKVIKEFSTGMIMKLKIISALAHHPKLLILDEPTSGLDPIARCEILEIFQEFIEDEENSIFVSSHITSDLEQVADYIIFIKNGNIVLNKEKDELIDNYAIVKCSEEEFNKIDAKDIIRYKKHKYECDVLINNRNNFKKKYNIKTIDKATLDDIMLLYIKGDEK